MDAEPDPVAFAQDVLSLLPSEPTDAKRQHLELLAAAHQGLGRRQLAARRRLLDLARAVCAEDCAVREVAEQEEALAAEFDGIAEAFDLLLPYARAAIAALGLDLDRLVDAIHPSPEDLLR